MKYIVFLLAWYPLLLLADTFNFTCMISSGNKTITTAGTLAKSTALASLSQDALEKTANQVFGQDMCSAVGQPVQAAYIKPVGLTAGNINVRQLQQFQAPNCTVLCQLQNP